MLLDRLPASEVSDIEQKWILCGLLQEDLPKKEPPLAIQTNPWSLSRHANEQQAKSGEVVRGSERGPHVPAAVTVSNDHFCDYATGLILLAATSQK